MLLDTPGVISITVLIKCWITFPADIKCTKNLSFDRMKRIMIKVLALVLVYGG